MFWFLVLVAGDVKAVRRPAKIEWNLRFRAPSSANGSRWESDSSHPLKFHWSPYRPGSKRNPFRSHRSWSLVVRVDGPQNSDFLVIRPEELQSFSDSSSVKPDVGNRLDGWLNELSLGNGQYDQFLPVSVICHGRDCHYLRHWRLSAQLRLTVWSSDDDKDAGRVKRHVGKKSAIPKKSSSSSSSSNKSNVTAKKRFAPQPKDILLGQHHGKKSGKPGDCSQKSKKCCPHSLKINFRQLPGFDWILEPSEIDIFMCKGDCHYAQFTAHGHHQHNPATNHALFQGYLHTINKRLVPKLCCTPSKLEAIQVVHYDQDNPAQLTTTKWEGAIVKECACA